MVEHPSNTPDSAFSAEDTQPIHLPARVESGRACRPALTRVTGPGIGQTTAVPAAGLVLGRGAAAGVRVEDEAVSREHARVWVDAEGVVRVTDLGSTNGTLLNGQRVDDAALAEGDKIQVGRWAVFRFSLNDRLDDNYLEHLYQTSIRDALTGLFNRRYLLECLERDLALSKRSGVPLTLVLLDVDEFKKVNDTFGHAGGDRVLRALAELLGSMQRHESIVARYGGEEMAVLLRGVGSVGGQVFAERMRQAVEGRPLPVGRGKVRLTISLGVASTELDHADTPEAFLEAADRYLYLSKRRGRNCVTTARTFTA